MKYIEEYWEDIEQVLCNIPNIDVVNEKSILLTGATGLIGSAVADMFLYLNKYKNSEIKLYLAGRNKRRVIERFAGFSENKDFYFVEYDATKNVKFDLSVDYIIHGASNADPNAYVSEPVETMLANIVGTNELLRMVVKGKAKRMLYISSSEVYGQKDDSSPYIENDYGYVDITNPRACYPSAKRAAETLCFSYGKEYNIDTVVVRPGHIYGPSILESDSRASAQFARKAAMKENIIMKSAGAQLRSYCYSVDCASAIITVLLNGDNGRAYNISNRNSVVTIRELAEALASYTGVKIEYENPTDIEKKGYNLMSNSSLNAEALEQLGWKAQFGLELGVKRTIDILSLELS